MPFGKAESVTWFNNNTLSYAVVFGIAFAVAAGLAIFGATNEARFLSFAGALAISVAAASIALWLSGGQRLALQVLLVATVLMGGLVFIFRSELSTAPLWSACGLGIVQISVAGLVSRWKFWRSCSASTLIGAAILLTFALLATFAPAIAPFGEFQVVGPPNSLISPEYWLGTDSIGRDVMSRIIFGARNSIAVALAANVLGFVIGGCLGLLAGTMKGIVDLLLSRINDVLMAIPQLISALLVLTLTGTSVISLILVIAVVDATRVFRLTRGLAIDIRSLDYVEAALMRGERLPWLMFKEILPNIKGPLLTEFGVRFCFVFLFISTLSFLGLGIQPPTADWGSMVKEGASLVAFGELTPLAPAGAIALVVLAVNLLLDGRRGR